MSGQQAQRPPTAPRRTTPHPSANPQPRVPFDGLNPYEFDYPKRDVAYAQANASVNQQIIVGGKLYRSLFHPDVINAISTAVNKHPLVLQNGGPRDTKFIAFKIRRFGPEAQAALNKQDPRQKASWIAASLIQLFSKPPTVEDSTPAYDMDQIAIATMKTNIRRDAPPPIRQQVPTQQPSEPSAPTLVPTHSAAILGYMTPHALSASMWSGTRGRRSYMYLDSVNRQTPDDTSTGEYRWQISADQYRLKEGVVTPSTRPRTIREIRIVNMSIPNLENAQGNLGEVSIQLRELVSQGYNTPEFIEHFVGTATPNGDRIEVDFSARTGGIVFNHPITSLESITLIMRNPTDVIDYGRDRARVSSTVALGATTTFTFIENFVGSFANINDLIRVVGFASDNGADGAIVATANRIAGHVATAVTSTDITLDLDTTLMVGAVDAASQIILYNLTKRIIFRIEIEHVEIADDGGQ